MRNTELVISTHLRNTGSVPLTIGAWHVLHLASANGGAIRLGSAPMMAATFFRWCPWDMRVERLGCDEGRHASDNLCHLSDPVTGITLLSGFTTMERMRGFHTLNTAADGSIEEYRATCTFGEYLLEPGRELAAETLCLSMHTDPYLALECWADRVHRNYQPVFADLPPVSWIGGS